MEIPFEQYAETKMEPGRDPGKKKREKLINRLELIKKEVAKNQTALEALTGAAQRGEMSFLYENCPEIAKQLTRTATRIGMIPAEYGIKEKNAYISRIATEKKQVQVTQTKEELHIILPELLPHRPQFDSTTRQMRYLYDVDKWRSDYYSALSAEFMRGKYRMMDEKACMIFFNHVKGNEAADVDNFEYKIITDLITLFVLVDDSHRNLCQYMDVVEDEDNYTEIIVCPLKRMGDYLDLD